MKITIDYTAHTFTDRALRPEALHILLKSLTFHSKPPGPGVQQATVTPAASLSRCSRFGMPPTIVTTGNFTSVVFIVFQTFFQRRSMIWGGPEPHQSQYFFATSSSIQPRTTPYQFAVWLGLASPDSELFLA